MLSYYNDNDLFCLDWLSNLMDAGVIAPGVLDDRSIEDVRPDDVRNFHRVHFFAGIGGWELALVLAGWPDDRPVWTGSCPCQPFSSAGKRQGATDRRHLWPAFYRLIAQCRPSTIFGEQVASPLGREWLSAVRLDLEDLGYACGAADLSAASVGAPHIRQRLWWVADAHERQRRWIAGSQERNSNRPQAGRKQGNRKLKRSGTNDWMGNTNSKRREIRIRLDKNDDAQTKSTSRKTVIETSNWDYNTFVYCADERLRPIPKIESGVFPLAYGVPNRVGRLRAYGNAIVPELAAVFVEAFTMTENLDPD